MRERCRWQERDVLLGFQTNKPKAFFSFLSFPNFKLALDETEFSITTTILNLVNKLKLNRKLFILNNKCIEKLLSFIGSCRRRKKKRECWSLTEPSEPSEPSLERFLGPISSSKENNDLLDNYRILLTHSFPFSRFLLTFPLSMKGTVQSTFLSLIQQLQAPSVPVWQWHSSMSILDSSWTHPRVILDIQWRIHGDSGVIDEPWMRKSWREVHRSPFWLISWCMGG